MVLLLADGYEQGPAGHAVIRQANNAGGLATLEAGQDWSIHARWSRSAR